MLLQPNSAGADDGGDDAVAKAAAAAARDLFNQLGPPADAEAAPTEPAAAPVDLMDEPSEAEIDDVIAEGKRLDGRDIYKELIKNRQRLRTVFQQGRIISTDQAGNPQQTNFWLHAKDYRDKNDKAVGGIFTKSIFKITGPYEMRHTGYLYVERDGDDDQQFMYSPSRGRTARVKLKGQSVAGTDFSFDDFLVSLDDIEDAEYERHADEELQGVSVYVVEAFVKPGSKTEYSRSLSYIEKEHFVAIRTRYWDEVGVPVKEAVVDRLKIEEFEGAWIPTETTVTDLLEDSSSTLHVDVLEPNPELTDEAFALSRLEYRP